MYPDKEALKLLKGREWGETCTGVFIVGVVITAVMQVAINFDWITQLDKVHTLEGVLLAFGWILARRIDGIDKQVMWLTERENQRLAQENAPVFHNNKE